MPAPRQSDVGAGPRSRSRGRALSRGGPPIARRLPCREQRGAVAPSPRSSHSRSPAWTPARRRDVGCLARTMSRAGRALLSVLWCRSPQVGRSCSTAQNFRPAFSCAVALMRYFREHAVPNGVLAQLRSPGKARARGEAHGEPRDRDGMMGVSSEPNRSWPRGARDPSRFAPAAAPNFPHPGDEVGPTRASELRRRAGSRANDPRNSAPSTSSSSPHRARHRVLPPTAESWRAGWPQRRARVTGGGRARVPVAFPWQYAGRGVTRRDSRWSSRAHLL